MKIIVECSLVVLVNYGVDILLCGEMEDFKDFHQVTGPIQKFTEVYYFF